MKTLYLLFCVLFSHIPSVYSQHGSDRHEGQANHRDSSAYIAMLENPERDSYQKPDEVVTALGLEKGESIADIGAGSGYFSFRFSQAVGAEGQVLGVDVNPDMIRYMNRRKFEVGSANVVTVLAEDANPLLLQDSVDRIFICNTWHHIPSQGEYLELLKRALRAEGEVIMIDYQKRELPVGPPVQTKIARADLISQMDAAGFQVKAEHNFLPYQYFIRFTVK